MSLAEVLFYGFWTVVGLAMAITYWPRSGAALYHHQYALWHACCRRRGLSQKEMQQEFLFRNALASLRRSASEAALSWPENYHRAIAELAAEQAEGLAIHDKVLSKRFLHVVDTSSVSDILYPDAFKTIARGISGVHATITANNIAALTTR